jgi:peptidoglycan-associated lipoprotein
MKNLPQFCCFRIDKFKTSDFGLCKQLAKGGDPVKSSHKRIFFSIGLIVIFTASFVGCKAAPPPAPGPPVSGAALTPPARAPRGLEFEFAENMKKVFFEFDKHRLTSRARMTLEKNAAWLRKHKDVKVQIEGHCDERGTIEYNLALGEKRSTSVRNYFMSLGIDGSRLFTISYGEEKPTAMGHNESAWAQNRRTGFKIAR